MASTLQEIIREQEKLPENERMSIQGLVGLVEAAQFTCHLTINGKSYTASEVFDPERMDFKEVLKTTELAFKRKLPELK